MSFFDFPLHTPWEQAMSFSGAFPAAQSAIAMGDPSNWQISKNNYSEPEKLFFDFTFQNPHPWSQQGSGKLCHRPTPRHMFEPTWSHQNRENAESWWNEAR